MKEDSLEPLAVKDGNVQLDLRPNQIVTVRFS
jgi:hypothetical protein